MPYGGGKRMRAPVGHILPQGKEVFQMLKAKLFSYKYSNIYFQKYGISPDKHFDRLRETYGTDYARETVDVNMENALLSAWLEEQQREEERQRILENECPFRDPPEHSLT